MRILLRKGFKMAEIINFFQIYWKDEQKSKLLPFAQGYKNEGLTPFFENSVIRNLVGQSQGDKIAVCSYQLAAKMTANIPPYRQLTEQVLHTDYDVLAFTKNSHGHGLLYQANVWHPGFRTIVNKIFNILGYKQPMEAKFPIYQNAFCAKTEVYKAYVNELLAPAMDLMEFHDEIRKLCWQDSQYYKLRDNPEFRTRVKHFLGTDYCPLHAFICERFFSLWLNDKNLNVQYL